MAATTRNILVGAAAVYLSRATSTDGSAAASIPTLTSASATVTLEAATGATGWRDIGYTTNGLEMSYEPNYGEVAVDQLLDAARLFKQSMRVTVKTEFSEATLENLFVVMNQSAGFATGTTDYAGTGGAVTGATGAVEIQGGSLGDYPVERSLIAVGQAPRPVGATKTERLYYASRVMSISTSAHGLKRDSATTFPVEFRLLPVGSTSNAYGKIVDRTYT